MPRKIWLIGLPAIALILLIGLTVRKPQNPAPVAPDPKTFKQIHVEVLNGCGVDGIAQQVGKHLRTAGFDVMSWENAKSFSYPETIVIDRVGKPEYALEVANALGVQTHIQQIVPDPFRIEQVTVIVGRDYHRLNLSAPVN